jgi:protein-disulfide isomerase
MRCHLRHLPILLGLSLLAGAQQKSGTHPAKNPPADVPKLELRPNLPSEETVNAFLQQMFGYNSALTWKVADIRPAEAEGLAEVIVVVSSTQGQQATKLYVTHDGKHALAGELMPFGPYPFEATRKQLEKGINGPGRGPANAAVTLVEFSDLQCPHCKAAAPVLDKLLSEEPNVRLVFQNYPLPGHDWAVKAADYADCVGRSSNDAFWKFIQGAFDAQNQITVANADEKLSNIADASGAKGAEVAACAAKPETQARVESSLALGKAVNITGTPTLFVNGRAIENVGSIPYDVLKKLVDFAAKEAQSQQAQAK